MGGTFLLKLNIDERPIANKYREGKMKSILKKKLKAPEIVKREALNSSQAATFLGLVVWFAVRDVVKPSRITCCAAGSFRCRRRVRIISVRVRRP